MSELRPRWIVVHHTGGTKDNALADTSHHTFEDVNAWHKIDPNVWLGKLSSIGYAIGYTYFIDKKGKVTQGRSDTEQSAHAKSYNNNPWDLPENYSIGICLAGNFDVTFPTPEQTKALELLLLKKTAEYSIPKDKIIPHRHVANKSCYGRNLPDDWARKLLEPIVATPTATNMCIAQELEIKELKAKITWFQSVFDWIATKWS